ncbi:CoA pyrophosphatase [Iodidimonas sp. SYSU 1G8]|uniref:NUDIX hydrolase n=1 Tax=Iodidimonas sp. SYSU 1G8 TaxID=3133967 RepID=UPI0031FEFCFB
MPYDFHDRFRDAIGTNLAAFPHEQIDTQGMRHAAVALTILAGDTPEDGASMLLTRRTSKLNKHAGQWALPGGRIDPGEDAFQAALREMREEINLELDETHFLGRLDDISSRSGYVISPYVFWATDTSAMTPNPDEVASIHRIPLGLFEGVDAVQFIDVEGQIEKMLRLQLGPHRIHSPTGAFLLQLWEAGVHGRPTRVKQHLHPDWSK